MMAHLIKYDGALVGFTKRIDGVSLDLAGNSFTLPTLTAAGDELPDPVDQYEVLPDAPLEDDTKYDAFDQPVEEDADDALLNRLFLPLVNR